MDELVHAARVSEDHGPVQLCDMPGGRMSGGCLDTVSCLVCKRIASLMGVVL